MSRARLAAALLLSFAAVLLPASERLAPAAHAQADAARIPLAEFKKLFDAKQVVVLDTRDAESYRAGHVPGALLVPESAVAARAAEIKAAGKLVVTYCT